MVERYTLSRHCPLSVAAVPWLRTVKLMSTLCPPTAFKGTLTSVTTRSARTSSPDTAIVREAKLLSSFGSGSAFGLWSSATKSVNEPLNVRGSVTSIERTTDWPTPSGVVTMRVPMAITWLPGPVALPVAERMITSFQFGCAAALPLLAARHETVIVSPAIALAGAVNSEATRSGSSSAKDCVKTSPVSPVSPGTPLPF